jgi:hypothetical protein
VLDVPLDLVAESKKDHKATNACGALGGGMLDARREIINEKIRGKSRVEHTG